MDSFLLGRIAAISLRMNLRRLTTWIFSAVFLLLVWLLLNGNVGFGGMTATGVKLATNSEYAIAAMLGAFSFMLMHFTATLTGDPIIKDVRLGTGALIWSTPLRRRTYVLGKFLGGYLSVLAIYAVFVAALILGQLIRSEETLTLAFRVLPYLKFTVVFLLVTTFFVGSISFAIGSLSGSMKLVYITVTLFLIAYLLALRLLGEENMRYIATFEPSGMIWLSEKVAKSRGNAWLNANPIHFDFAILMNRAVLLAIGAGALALCVRRFDPQRLTGENSAEIRAGSAERLWRWLRHRGPVEDRYQVWVGRTSVPAVQPAAMGVKLWLATLRGSIATELRLLAAERSLWIMVPMVMFTCGVNAITFSGPFNVPIYPVSSEYAQQMVPGLLVLLAGTSIFYTGEVFHRDDAYGVRAIIYASPVRSSALLLGKLASMSLLSIGIVLLTILTAIASQLVHWSIWVDGRFYLDLLPYWLIFCRILLPSCLLLCGISLAVNVLVRGRYLAYFTLIALAAMSIWGLIEAKFSLLHNPLLLQQWSYSDITLLEPFSNRLGLHHLYWGAILLSLFGLATWFLPRTQSGWGYFFRPSRVRAVPGLFIWTLLTALLAVWLGLRIDAGETPRGSRDEQEALALEMEDRYLDKLELPQLGLASLELSVDLHPSSKSLDARASMQVANHFDQPIETAYFTADPLYSIRRLEIEGQAAPYTRDGWILSVPLAHPLAPGERTAMHLEWSGRVNPGIPPSGAVQNTFIHDSAVFLSSFNSEIIPSFGVNPEIFLGDKKRRKKLGRGELHFLRDRSGEAFVPSFLGHNQPFDYLAHISVPRGLTVISGGELEDRRTVAERETFTWRSPKPLYSFPILAAEYAVATDGDDEIYHHPEHTYNLGTIREGLRDGRELFERHYGPYPHRALRIVEFPRLAGFAQSYPTVMPYSESIGFLTNFRDADRHIDSTYFVTLHEVAHQWWAYLVNPGASLGAQVLAESLAEYSALLAIDEKRGEHQRLTFLKKEEDSYLRQRDPDEEKALVELEFEGQYVWYQKGCLVFYMLERQLGRPRLLAALRSFVNRWRYDEAESDRPLSHPTLRDLIDELREHQGEQDLEWFYDLWFEDVVVPDVALIEARPRPQGEGYAIEFSATNQGGGRVPVQVEAIAGEWNLEQPQSEDGAFRSSQPLRIWLEAGQAMRGTVSASFRPEALIIDRLYETIDFDRTNNRLPLNLGEVEDERAPPAAASIR